MNKFYKFTIASLKMFFRNRQAVFFSFFMPLMIMIIFGLIDFEKFGTTRIEIYDADKTEVSESFIKVIKGIEILDTNENESLENAKEKLADGDTDLVLHLPKNIFVLDPTKEKSKEIMVYLNQGRAQQGQLGLTVIREVLNNFEKEITKTPSLFEIKSETIDSFDLRYIDFLVPGILGLSIMQMSLFSIIFAIVAFKKAGVMKRLFITPIKPYQFIGGQVFTRMAVSILQIVVILLLAVLAFKVKIVGSYLILALLVFWGSIIFLALGLALASFAKTEEAAAPIANVVAMPQMFLGNVFFPVESMPEWLQSIVQYLPLNYLADALRKVMTEGVGLREISGDLWGLVAWSVITIALAVIFFRWKEE